MLSGSSSLMNGGSISYIAGDGMDGGNIELKAGMSNSPHGIGGSIRVASGAASGANSASGNITVAGGDAFSGGSMHIVSGDARDVLGIGGNLLLIWMKSKVKWKVVMSPLCLVIHSNNLGVYVSNLVTVSFLVEIPVFRQEMRILAVPLSLEVVTVSSHQVRRGM